MKPSRATFLLLFLFAVMTAVSWLTWANPIVDGGREMNTPLRLLHGDMLYSEVYYLYGPVAPYVNALLFSVFGIHLNTLYAAGIAGSLMLVMLVFYLGRRFMTTWEAMLAAAAVLFLSVFKQSGNLIFPYSYSALYGTVAGVLALIMQLRYLHTKKVSSLIAAGLFSGLALCCKTEFGLAAVASLLTLVILSPRERWRVFLIAFGSFALLPFLIYGTVLAMIPAESLIADTFILPGTIPPELLYFNKLKMGLFDVGRTVRELLSAIALLAGVAGAISLVGRRRAGEPITLCGADRRLRAIWMITFCGWGFLLLQLPLFGTEWDLNPVRAFPVLFIWLIIVIACRSTRLRTMTFSDGALLLIAVYSLAVLARVILRTPAGGAYGSVLIPVPIVLFFIMTVSLLPPLIGSTAVALQVRRMVVLLLTAAVTATMAMISLRHASSDMEYLHTKRGSLRLQEPGTMVMRQALDYIERNSSPGDYVLALPEGSSLNFLSDRPAPLRYEILTPGFLTENKEREAIRTLKEKNVGLLLVINRATPEFGPEVIGRDYYRTLMGWIEYNYEMTAIFGDGVSPDIEIGDPAFFIKCYRKRK